MIEDIKKDCQVMNEGGVILYPTDTVWGIGCDATNEEAVRLSLIHIFVTVGKKADFDVHSFCK